MLDDYRQRREAMLIGQRVSWAREAHELNRQQLAKCVGTSRDAIHKIETGLRIPSVFLVQSLCHVLRISPQYLLWGSLQGVDEELAATLAVAHPELGEPIEKPFPGKTRKSMRSKPAIAATVGM
jgi:DNA-binding XRE family transcriptional regulator